MKFRTSAEATPYAYRIGKQKSQAALPTNAGERIRPKQQKCQTNDGGPLDKTTEGLKDKKDFWGTAELIRI